MMLPVAAYGTTLYSVLIAYRQPVISVCEMGRICGKGKGKGAVPQWGLGEVLISQTLAGEPVGGWTTESDTWPVRRQTYGYLPSCRASPPFGRYQIILLGDRGTWV